MDNPNSQEYVYMQELVCPSCDTPQNDAFRSFAAVDVLSRSIPTQRTQCVKCRKEFEWDAKFQWIFRVKKIDRED